MSDDSIVAEITFVQATGREANDGILCWASCRYGNLGLAGLAVRITLAGDLVVTFPARRDRKGRQHAYIAPRDTATRRAIEKAILEAYARSTEAAR